MSQETLTAQTPQFLNEWNPNQFKAIEKAITKHFVNRPFHTRHGDYPNKKNYTQIDQILGLAYTSSSSYAAYWICNTELYFDVEARWYYNAFTIGRDGKFYALIMDKVESEFIIEL